MELRTVLLLAFLPLSVAGPAAAEAPDLKAMLEQSEQVQKADEAAWLGFAFRRHVTRQGLNDEGEVESRQEMLFQVTPTAAGIDEELMEIDGRPPTAKEVKEHRKAGRHVKHYEKITSGEISNPFGKDLATRPLIYDQEHRYVGEEEVDGIRCHRVAFDARPDSKDLPAAQQLIRAIKGSACFSLEGLHLVEGELETVRGVKKGSAGLAHLRMRFEYRPFGEAWVPHLLEMRSEVKVPGRRDPRTWNFYRYSEYRLPEGGMD